MNKGRWILSEDEKAKLFCSLEDLSENALPLYGSKAINLGKLIRNGICVPKGYAISTKLYSLFLEYNKFPYSSVNYLSQNEKITKFLINGEFPPKIKEQLRNIYSSITGQDNDQSFTVRPSTPYEDMESYSMAGVFDSFINLTTYKELELSIKKCYASLFSDKALSFMVEQSLDIRNIKMGIVIQEFISGRPSGVIFTADAINMVEDTIIINAVDSICSDYVEGRLPSSLYKVDKHSGHIVESNVDILSPSLTKSQIKLIHKTAVEIEKAMGCFQDIEWTIKKGTISILQSRPITTFNCDNRTIEWSTPYDQYTWFLAHYEPLKPLLQDILFFQSNGKSIGAEISGKKEPCYNIINGYPYYYLKSGNTKKRKYFVNELEQLFKQGDNIYQDVILPQILENQEKLDSLLKEDLLPTNSVDFFNKAIEFLVKVEELHIISVDGYLNIESFKNYCKEKNIMLEDNDFYDLVYQTSWLSKEREHIMRMASFVKADKELVYLFKKHLYDKILLAHLENYQSGRDLLKLIDTYLKEFGVFPIKGSWSISSKTLFEVPEIVLSKIRTYLEVEIKSYYKNIQKTLENKQMIIQSITSDMDKEEKEDFLTKLRAAEKAFLVNDDHCYYLDMTACGYFRLAIIKVAKVLVEKNILQKPEDVYFLNLEEIKDILLNNKKDIYKNIENRKIIFKHQKHLNSPKVLGQVHEEDEILQLENKNYKTFKGVSGLRKKVRGKVKVIKDNISEETNVEENSILVLKHGHSCYFLPFLNKIKGLIYDYGSPFDHPGIIAREMDIPSIYNTKIATKVLNDGDEIELDGINGQVVILGSTT